MKKILFPTDFSDNSLNAFRYALNIAKKFGAEIVTMHAYTIPIGVVAPDGLVEPVMDLAASFEEEEYARFIEILDGIREDEKASDIKIDHRLEVGATVKGIVNLTQEEDFDFIVMSTAGAEGLGRWLFGSVAGDVVSKANCPVLVIPKEAKYKSIHKIAFATNYEDFGEPMGQELVEWMVRFNAEMHFVHIARPSEYISLEQYENMKELREMADQYDNVKFKVIPDVSILDTLEDFIEEINIDMMVMVTHQYPFYKRIFQPSVTKQMTFETEIPLLVYHVV